MRQLHLPFDDELRLVDHDSILRWIRDRCRRSLDEHIVVGRALYDFRKRNKG